MSHNLARAVGAQQQRVAHVEGMHEKYKRHVFAAKGGGLEAGRGIGLGAWGVKGHMAWAGGTHGALRAAFGRAPRLPARQAKHPLPIAA